MYYILYIYTYVKGKINSTFLHSNNLFAIISTFAHYCKNYNA